MPLKLSYVYSIFFLIESALYADRSIHRPIDKSIPEIVAYWPGSSKKYHLRDSHLEECAIFKKFERDFFFSHMVPRGRITYRNRPKESVDSAVLQALLEKLIKDVKSGDMNKDALADFTILKARDFNWKYCSGLMVLKFKNYPFVIKLFFKQPRTFVRPYSEGVESGCLFIMGRGITRYLSGFTRIKNLEAIKKHIEQDPYWRNKIELPRKWFWQPQNNKWFIVEGFNIGPQKYQKIELPSVYGILCDAIEGEEALNLFNKANRQLGVELSSFLGNRVDPHIDNFMIEKGTGKIILVDTEHFPTMIGLREPLVFKTYLSWYWQLMCKYVKDRYFRSKQDRLAANARSAPEIQWC